VVPEPSRTAAQAGLGQETLLARLGLAGLFLSGLVFAFPGAILPAWGYHVREDYISVGNYFLSMVAGLWLAPLVARRALRGSSVITVLVAGSATVCAGLFLLALLPPGFSEWWRLAATVVLGIGAGLINRGAFQAVASLYRRDATATLYLAGISFGAGCVTISLLVAGTYYVYTVRSILVWIALLPAFFCGIYARAARTHKEAFAPALPDLGAGWQWTAAGLKGPVVALLVVLLFFQFGNEWSLGGWLPLLLSKRVGVSPAASLLMLTLYWLALLVGRVMASALLTRTPHGRLLIASASAALMGCTILASTNNRFGAVVGILLVGCGFASVYPLAAGRISGSFRGYHPGFFNGVFSLAVTGGLLAPWSLGFLVARWGTRAVIAVPLVGTLMVFLLVLLLWAEAKLGAADI